MEVKQILWVIREDIRNIWFCWNVNILTLWLFSTECGNRMFSLSNDWDKALKLILSHEGLLYSQRHSVTLSFRNRLLEEFRSGLYNYKYSSWVRQPPMFEIERDLLCRNYLSVIFLENVISDSQIQTCAPEGQN